MKSSEGGRWYDRFLEPLHMKSAEGKYRDMLLEPTVSTSLFHEILGELLNDGADEKILEHMDALLHVPTSDIKWQQRAIQLACKGLIATVTENEALMEEMEEEDSEDWDTVAGRVIANRRKRQV